MGNGEPLELGSGEFGVLMTFVLSTVCESIGFNL